MPKQTLFGRLVHQFVEASKRGRSKEAEYLLSQMRSLDNERANNVAENVLWRLAGYQIARVKLP